MAAPVVGSWILDTTLVQAVSAAVQAVAAIIIVILTVLLARTAAAALAEAGRQAKAAEVALEHAAAQARQAMRANEEARRQRQLAVVPVLDVSPAFRGATDEGHLRARFVVRNPGPAVALNVRVLAYGMVTRDRAELQERCSSKPIPVLAPGDEHEVTLDMESFRHVPTPHSRDARPALFSNDWIRVNATCQGILGARCAHRYDWLANDEDRTPFWELVEVQLVPDPEDERWSVRLDTRR